MMDEIVLARMMTALDLKFKKAMHYHDEGYNSDNDNGLPPQVMRSVHIYSVLPLRPPLPWLNTREHNALSPLSHPDDPEACHSLQGSAGT